MSIILSFDGAEADTLTSDQMPIPASLQSVATTDEEILSQWALLPFQIRHKKSMSHVNAIIQETMTDREITSRVCPKWAQHEILQFARQWSDGALNPLEPTDQENFVINSSLVAALRGGAYLCPRWASPYTWCLDTDRFRRYGNILVGGSGVICVGFDLPLAAIVLWVVIVVVEATYAFFLSGTSHKKTKRVVTISPPIDLDPPSIDQKSDTSIPRAGVLMFNVGSATEYRVLTVDAGVLHDHVMLIGLRGDMTIALWNRGAEILTGFNNAACIGVSVMGLVTEESQTQFGKLLTSHSLDPVPITMFHASKASVTLSVHVVPARFAEGGQQGGLFLVGHVHHTNSEAATSAFRVCGTHHAMTHAQAVCDLSLQQGSHTEIGQHAVQCLRHISSLHPHATSDAMTKWAAFPAVNLHQFTGETVLPVTTINVRVDIDVSEAIPEFTRWDSEKLTDMIKYLIINAVKVHASHILVKVQQQTRTTNQNESVAMIEFEVSDNGCGMSKGRLGELVSQGAFSMALGCDKVRDCSARKKGSRGRLVTVTEALEALGGSLLCSSGEGVGTKMKIQIPYIPAEGWANEHNSNNGLHRAKRLDIVLLERNPVYRIGLTQVLWQRGHSVSLAVDFADLVSIVESCTINIVLCDIQMVPGDCQDKNLKAIAQHSTVCLMVDKDFGDSLSSDGFQVMQRPVSTRELINILTLATSKVIREQERQAQIAKVRSVFTAHNSCSWEKLQKLGSGAFGDVYKARNLMTGGTMAVKVIRVSSEDRDAEQKVQDLVNEVALLKTLEHEHIIHYLYCEPGNGCINVFMEYASGGTVAGIIEKKRGGGLSTAKAAGYMRELLKAVAFVHEHSIMHRDIKCANLLLSEDGKLKLGDFGTAEHLDATKPVTEMKGTLRFMAPEVCKEEPHDGACDIWSIGCTLVEMLTGHQPMPHIEGSYLQVIAQLTSLTVHDIIPIPDSITDHARSFVSQCLSVDPNARPSAKTLLSHPFITRVKMTSPTISVARFQEEATDDYFDRKFSGWGGDVSPSPSLKKDDDRKVSVVQIQPRSPEPDDRKFSGWGYEVAPVVKATTKHPPPAHIMFLDSNSGEDSERKGSVWCNYE